MDIIGGALVTYGQQNERQSKDKEQWNTEKLSPYIPLNNYLIEKTTVQPGIESRTS